MRILHWLLGTNDASAFERYLGDLQLSRLYGVPTVDEAKRDYYQAVSPREYMAL